MFDRNDPARPSLKQWPYVPHNGFTKFEQCAMRFTEALLPLEEFTIKEAVKTGILAAEEFCKQMEEREKDGLDK
jgi:hypothetical protein